MTVTGHPARAVRRPGLVPLAAALAALAACSAPPPHASADPAGGEWRTLPAPELVVASGPASQDEPPQPEHDAEALAKKLSNPVAALISVPFQGNYDKDIGPNDDGEKYYVNVQPVVPITLNEDWNLISRTIVPLVSQDDVVPGSSESGLGDITQSLFFSPAKPTESGLIWGAGPAFLLPAATDDELGAEKWGVGPTAVGLKQEGPWTIGALGNHIWSVAGDDDRADISATFLQPFLTYTTKEAWTYGLNTESTYDWKDTEWSIPVNAFVSKVTRVGDQLVQFGGGLRYWADSPPDGPEGLGARLFVTLLYPRG